MGRTAGLGLYRFEEWAERLMRRPRRTRMIDGMEPVGTLYRIEDDLSQDWLAALAGDGVSELESYLAKHLAFLSFLEDGAA